jgi:hypothetical protein
VRLSPAFSTALLRSLFIQIAVFALFALLCFFFPRPGILNETNFGNWDAAHYANIRSNGYSGFLVAFFPLFPWLWKISHLGAWGIAALNSTLFLFSFAALLSHFRPSLKEHLLLQSIPSLVFMCIPYTEALFFFCCTLVLIGLYKEKMLLIAGGLLLSSLCRPTTYIFIPAILLILFCYRKPGKSVIPEGILYTSVLLAGLFLTVCVHYYYTGIWFVFFKAQEGWSNSLRIPILPLRSWAGNNITRLDGTALATGVFAGIACLNACITYFKNKVLTVGKEVLFSLMYLAGISLLILFFRGGSLFSLNRFVFATPFFTLAFLYFLRNVRLQGKQIAYLFIGLSAFWLLFGSYVHIQAFLKYELLSAFLLLPFLLTADLKWISRISYILFLGTNLLLQAYFLYRFLGNEWIG